MRLKVVLEKAVYVIRQADREGYLGESINNQANIQQNCVCAISTHTPMLFVALFRETRLGSSIYISSCVITSALPSPLTLDELATLRIELDWKISLAKCEARVLRDNRRINSRHPTVFLSYGCAEAIGERLEEACAVRDAWLPSMPVRVVTNEDPMWLVEGWSAHDEDFDNKMLELRVDEDIRDRALIMGNPFLGQSNGPSIFDDADIKRTIEAYKRRDAKKAKCADNDDEHDAIADDEQDTTTTDDAQDTKVTYPSRD